MRGIEDAAGIEAGRRAGMFTVGVGSSKFSTKRTS